MGSCRGQLLQVSDGKKEFYVKKETEEFTRLVSRFFFGLYLLLLIYLMFFAEEWGRFILEGDYR